MTLHFFFGLGISIKLHFPVLLGGGIPKYHLYDLYDTKKLHIYTYVCDSNCVLVDWTTALQVLSLADTSRCRNCAQFAHRCCLERRLLALDVGSAEWRQRVGYWKVAQFDPFSVIFFLAKLQDIIDLIPWRWIWCWCVDVWYVWYASPPDSWWEIMVGLRISQFIHGVSFITVLCAWLFHCPSEMDPSSPDVCTCLNHSQGWFVEPQSTQGIHISSSLSSNVTANSG